jgi:putative membrane protein
MKTFETPQRQSPLALVMMFFKIFRTVITVIWPALIGLLLGGKKGNVGLKWLIAGASILLFVLIRTVLDYLYFRFSIKDGQLVVRKGFFYKTAITVPLERIQAVHLEQSFLHSVTLTHKLIIDTAGKEGAEVTIYAIPSSDAVALRTLILNRVDESKTVTEAEAKPVAKLISRLDLPGLLKLSLSANHIETIAVVLVFLIGRYEDVKPILGNTPFLNELVSYGETMKYTWQLLTTLFVIVTVITIIISCIRMFLRFYNYTVRMDRKGYYIRWGLLQVKQKMIPFKRIQMIRWRSNFIRRLIGLALLNLKVSGTDETKKKVLIELPITDTGQIRQIVPVYQPVLPSETGAATQKIHRSYAYRKTLFITLPVLIVVAGCLALVWQWYALLVFIWLPYSLGLQLLYCRNFCFWTTPEGLQQYESTWGRAEAILNWKNIQYIQIRQSIYQRKKGLATLSLHTAGGQFQIPYITHEQALAISNYALFRIESTQENWM